MSKKTQPTTGPTEETAASTVISDTSGAPPAVETDNASAAPPDPASPSQEPAAPLLAGTMVNLSGRYYEPGAVLPADQVARAGEPAIAALLEAGAIRRG